MTASSGRSSWPKGKMMQSHHGPRRFSLRWMSVLLLLLGTTLAVPPNDSRAATGTVAEWNAPDGTSGSCSDPDELSVNGPWECGIVHAEAHDAECTWIGTTLPPSGTCQVELNGATSSGMITKVKLDETGARGYDCLAAGNGSANVTIRGATIPIPVVFEIKGNGKRLVLEPGGTTWVTAATGRFDGEYIDILNERLITTSGTFDWVCRPVGPQGWAPPLSFRGQFSVSDL